MQSLGDWLSIADEVGLGSNVESEGSVSANQRKASESARSFAADQQAQSLIEKGVPSQLAYAVAQGKMSFNDALSRMADRDRLERLASQHGLSRSIAQQIVLGQLALDDVLFKRRIQAYKEERFGYSFLEEAATSGKTVVLGVHGSKQLNVRVLEVTDYEVLVADSKGNTSQCKKIEVKYAYWADDWKLAGKAVKVPRAADEEVVPIAKPQHRYRCSDKRLFTLMEHANRLRVTLLESVELRGTLCWVSRYELGLRIKGDVEITLFRHALSGLWAEPHKSS